MSEEINEIACKHCDEVMCSVCENKTCDDTHLATLKCREWRDRRAGFYCGYEQATRELAEENKKLKNTLKDVVNWFTKDLDIKTYADIASVLETAQILLGVSN